MHIKQSEQGCCPEQCHDLILELAAQRPERSELPAQELGHGISQDPTETKSAQQHASRAKPICATENKSGT